MQNLLLIMIIKPNHPFSCSFCLEKMKHQSTYGHFYSFLKANWNYIEVVKHWVFGRNELSLVASVIRYLWWNSFYICNLVLCSFMGPCPHLNPSSQLQVVLVSHISILESRHVPIAHYWVRKEMLWDCLSFSLPIQNYCHLHTPLPALGEEQWVLGS